MAVNKNILFVRGSNDVSSDDVWDDTALIKAYDIAINLAKKEVIKIIGAENNETQQNCPKQNTQKTRKWYIGSPCRALYSEDGQFYEATIIKIFENTGKCIVKFIGYNNTEKVELSALLESEGLLSQTAQREAAAAEQASNSMEFEETEKRSKPKGNAESHDVNNSIYAPDSSFNEAFGGMPPSMPLPPQLMARLPENDADALSSMLMSWYISGFHTGYYHGLQKVQSQQRKK